MQCRPVAGGRPSRKNVCDSLQPPHHCAMSRRVAAAAPRGIWAKRGNKQTVRECVGGEGGCKNQCWRLYSRYERLRWGEKGERDGVGGVWRMRSGRSIFGTDGKGSPVRGGWLAGRGYKGLDLRVRLVCVCCQALKRSSARARTLSTAANVESASLGSGRDEA